MSLVKLLPCHCPKIWGFEEWQFSTHHNGMTKVAATNQALETYLGQQLPILIKYIEANETLSVQVHPDDEYAQAHTSDRGKTECWYITEAEPGAQLIFGLKPTLTADVLRQLIAEQKLEEQLAFIDIQAGDMMYIPAGTVHAIMGGIKLIEIQQSSDTTYRLYDWGRDRELHIAESLAVIDYEHKNGAKKIPASEFTRLETPYFTVEKYHIQDQFRLESRQAATLTLVEGSLHYEHEQQQNSIQLNETLYLESQAVQLIGTGTVLITTWDY